MKTAFLSDIHANLAALEVVLSDVRRRDAGRIVCLGDIVGYGPRPMECLELILDAADLSVLGNHDYYTAFGGRMLRGLREDVADGIAVARNSLDEHHLDALRALPLSVRCGDCVCVHSSLQDPQSFPYVHTTREAREHFAAQTTPMGFIGHSHVPRAWQADAAGTIAKAPVEKGSLAIRPGVRYLINAGSVGQPRDGDPRACYALYDEEAGTVTWPRVPYDVKTTTDAMLALGMPAFSANRLSKGI